MQLQMHTAVARADAALWLLLAGLTLLASEAGCLRGSALVAELKAKAKAALLNPSPNPNPEDAAVATVEGASEDGAVGGNGTMRPVLTGDPQKDYVYDPNLPRELNGYNLSSYPFYNGVPPNIKFDCDDLHDGFYASVLHKCQVYHHCLYGTRYDFLCANYTAFDQRTFICHFVSEVDCDNSPKFYQRNEALYKEASTSPPVTTTTTPPPPPPPSATAAPPTADARRPDRPHRRRPPGRRRRPVYEYYDDDQYDEDEYYDEEPSPLPPTARRKATRKHRPQGKHRGEEDDYYEERREASQGEHQKQEQTSEMAATVRTGGPAAGTVYDRPRVPPKIRRPVPVHERDKYDYAPKTADTDPTPTPTRDTKNPSTQRKATDDDEDEYYDEEYDEDYVKPAPKRTKPGSDSRRANGRYRPRQPSRKRPDRYDDDYEEERFVRPRKRTRFEDTRPSGSSRGGASGGQRNRFRDEPDPVPADRPSFISNGRFSTGSRKAAETDRGQQQPKKKPSRAVYDDEEEDEEYYDDEEEEEESDAVRRSHKPLAIPESAGSKRKSPPGEQRSASRQTPTVEDRCRRNCDRGHSDEQDDDSVSLKDKGVERDNQRQENKNQKHDSGRERLFSSPFRDSQNEPSKLKGKTPDNKFQGRPSSGLRSTTLSPEPIQRQVYVPRPKSSSDEYVTSSQTKLPPLAEDTMTVDFSEESSSGNVKLTNFRSKGRPSASNPLTYTNTRSMLTARQQQETAEQLEPSPDTIREEPGNPPDGKSYSMPRPFSGTARRQLKTTTEPIPIDELPAYPPDLRDRQSEPINVEEKRARKPENINVSYKNVLPESPGVETYEPDQLRTTYTQVNSGSEGKPVKDFKSDYIPYDINDRKEIPNVKENVNLTKQSISEKIQLTSPNIGVYRRVKVTPTPQTEEPTPSYEDDQASRPGNNKRPYTLVRPISPLSDRPIAVEDTTKNAVSSSGVPVRRPVKQRIEESERTTPTELRQGSIAYFTSKRGKIRPDENLRGRDRYTKRLSLNGESLFSKQLPKIEITAPGPSAPDSDRSEIATIKSDYKNDYNAASEGFTLDIPEEEYDVTLNDALQPSTLHPSRSLIDYRRSGPKARERPYSVRDPDYVNGGRAASVVAYRAVPALPASQRYEAQQQDSPTDGESSANRNQEEYEAIVLTATGGGPGRQSQPTEWFW